MAVSDGMFDQISIFYCTGSELSDHEVEVWHSAEEDIDVVSLDARQTGTVNQTS